LSNSARVCKDAVADIGFSYLNFLDKRITQKLFQTKPLFR